MTRRRIFKARALDEYCACGNYLAAAIERIGNLMRKDPKFRHDYDLSEAHDDALSAIRAIKHLVRLESALWDELGEHGLQGLAERRRAKVLRHLRTVLRPQ